jgi:hypothetical protein
MSKHRLLKLIQPDKVGNAIVMECFPDLFTRQSLTQLSRDDKHFHGVVIWCDADFKGSVGTYSRFWLKTSFEPINGGVTVFSSDGLGDVPDASDEFDYDSWTPGDDIDPDDVDRFIS